DCRWSRRLARVCNECSKGRGGHLRPSLGRCLPTTAASLSRKPRSMRSWRGAVRVIFPSCWQPSRAPAARPSIFTRWGPRPPFSAPLIVVNGPVRARIGVNSGFGVFGPGFRANATIGRALRLLMINVGGARAGETSMSTFGHPGRYTYCIAEHEEASPWPPYHVDRGLGAGTSAVTLFAGEAPHGISDHSSRTARQLAGSLGWSVAGIWNSKHFPLYSHTMLVVGPEHARTFGDDGWSKDDLRRFLYETIRRPYGDLVPDEGHGEGSNLRFLRTPPAPEALVAKFPSPEEIHVVVAGGTAGRFSMVVPGWLGTRNGSAPVTRPIEGG